MGARVVCVGRARTLRRNGCDRALLVPEQRAQVPSLEGLVAIVGKGMCQAQHGRCRRCAVIYACVPCVCIGGKGMCLCRSGAGGRAGLVHSVGVRFRCFGQAASERLVADDRGVQHYCCMSCFCAGSWTAIAVLAAWRGVRAGHICTSSVNASRFVRARIAVLSLLVTSRLRVCQGTLRHEPGWICTCSHGGRGVAGEVEACCLGREHAPTLHACLFRVWSGSCCTA